MAGEEIEPAIILLKDAEVKCALVSPWSGDEHKRSMLGAIRELAAGLEVDAVAMIADVFVGGDRDLRPSQDPSAREALLAVGMMPEGLLQAMMLYGRRDDGSIYLDAEKTFEIADDARSRPGLRADGVVVEAFAGVLRGDVPVPALGVGDLVKRVEAVGGVVLYAAE